MTTLAPKPQRLAALRPLAPTADASIAAAWDVRMVASADHFPDLWKMIELSKGDQALFGGHTTQDMKTRLGVPDNRPLADSLLQKISKRLNAA